jgi:hypothetical protein
LGGHLFPPDIAIQSFFDLPVAHRGDEREYYSAGAATCARSWRNLTFKRNS